MNIDIPNAQMPFPGILTGGQPSGQHLEQARDAGFKLVINTRGIGEPGTDIEPSYVEELGMSYLHLPVSGPADITVETAKALTDALESAAGPVMVHCASGNRVGALFALKAFHIEGLSREDALTVGRSAGLTGMEPFVSSLLS